MSKYVNNCTFDYDQIYYKVIGAETCDVDYEIGLVQDNGIFQPSKWLRPDGIDFTRKESLPICYGLHGYKIAELKIPPRTPVYLCATGERWIAPQIEILRFLSWKEINELGLLSETQQCIINMGDSNKHLYHVLLHTNLELFPFIPDKYKIEAVCSLAVHKNGENLQYVPHELRTTNLCNVAMRQNGHLLKYVPQDLRNVGTCVSAVYECGTSLKYVPDELKTVDLCTLAINRGYKSFRYVPQDLKTVELCTTAVSNYGLNIRYVPEALLSVELCALAISSDATCLPYIPFEFRTFEMFDTDNEYSSDKE